MCWTGAASSASSFALLRQAYPQAQILAVEPDAERSAATAQPLALPWWSPRRWTGAATTVACAADVGDEQGQLLWSNMGLHLAVDPQAVMATWQRALAVDGFLMFSTLGPGSLTGLRQLYAEAGWPAPFAPFVDMHDLGDMLLHAGFADPVMDQEHITLTWSSPEALLLELRSLGGNAAVTRFPALRTARWRQELLRRLEQRRSTDGRIALGFEVVYGHAFKALPKARLGAETAVPLSDMRAMVAATRRAR